MAWTLSIFHSEWDVNDPLSPTSVAVNNAMLSGVVTVVAAGNAGPGEGTVGSPGSAALPISVGASDVSQTIPTFTATANEATYTDVKLLAKKFTTKLADYQDQSYPVVYVGLGTSSDFAGKDVEGKIALIERGEITFDEKIKNAKEAGAEATIIYNNEAGQIPFFIGESTAYIPSFRLSKKDGEKLKAGLSEDADFTFGELGNTKSEGDHLADFSSRGPVAQNYDIKPDVVAPGVAIFSTFPSYVNDPEGNNYDLAYSRLQGTSMASPHVAGTAALILQENPDYTPFDVKTALMNTAVDLQEDYSVYEVGAGRINAYDAVHDATSIKVLDQTEMLDGEQSVVIDEETGSLAFGSHYLSEGKGLEDSRKIDFENSSTDEKAYTVDVEFLPAKGDRQDAAENGVEIDVPDSVTLAAEQTKDVEPTITVPKNAAHGTYEGYIHVENQNDADESFQIPFAIRVTDKGIDYVDLDRPAVPNEWTFHSFLVPFIGFVFKLKSPMETIDVIIKDGDTDEPIGLVGTINASNDIPDKEYYVLRAFMGSVYKFTDDPEQPISEELVDLPEGDYKLEIIGNAADGETYTKEKVVAVDNTPAEMSFNDMKPGIHEIDESMYSDEDGYHALWVHTNVYDSTIDLLNSKGLDYDQSENKVAYYQNSPFPGILPVAENGDMKFGVLPEEIENGPLNLDLMPVDLATNADLTNQTRYTFVKKGTEYGSATYDKEEVRLGDELTLTLSLSNVKDLISGEFDVEFNHDIYQFNDVKVNKEFADYAKEQDVNVTLDEPTITESQFTDTVKLGAAFNETDFAGFNGDIDFLDVTFEVVSDEYYGENAQLNFEAIKDFNYKRAGATEAESIPVFTHDQYTFVSKHSTITGFIDPEAFLHEDGFILRKDYEGMGVKISAKAPNGKVYDGTIDEFGQFTIKGLPLSDEAYEITIDVPGHLDSVLTTKLGKESNGELVGESLRVYPDFSYAGDVNDDGMIDIMDVMRIVAHYGKENKKADLNRDGIVDETDIRYIEQNFMRVGPNANKNRQPKEKLGKKSLNDFLEALGLEPIDE